jgi:hypothetical protein
MGRCQSGRMGLPAKQLPGLNSAAGSNPVLPASNTRPRGGFLLSGLYLPFPR